MIVLLLSPVQFVIFDRQPTGGSPQASTELAGLRLHHLGLTTRVSFLLVVAPSYPIASVWMLNRPLNSRGSEQPAYEWTI